MAVREACPVHAPGNSQAGSGLGRVRGEVLVEVGDHGIHGVAIEGQEGVVVCQADYAQVDILL